MRVVLGGDALGAGVVAFDDDHGVVHVLFDQRELGAVFLKSVRDVFQEVEAQDDVLVFRRGHVVAGLVGGEPDPANAGCEAEVGGRVLGCLAGCTGHIS